MGENLLMSTILTCVYCGHEYPADTPASGAPILTAHIKVCTKHPMRAAEKFRDYTAFQLYRVECTMVGNMPLPWSALREERKRHFLTRADDKLACWLSDEDTEKHIAEVTGGVL